MLFNFREKEKELRISLRVMLTSVLKALIKNLVKENFYKKKKKQLIFWQFFSFSVKVMSKFSLIKFLTSALKALVNIFLSLKFINIILYNYIKMCKNDTE